MADDKKEKPSALLSVEDALKMHEDYKTYWADNYIEAEIDLKMAAGDRPTHWGSGWDSSYKSLPEGKPAIVINELPQYIHQVTNDIRQNVPSIKALPEADGDVETGKIFSGLFRAIEYRSHADEVCDTASEYAVTCSIGFMRLDHDYCEDESDEQEILFKTVPDPLSVWIDPSSIEYDGRDANGAIALEPINKKDFERLYPGKAFSSFVDPKNNDNKDNIIIAEIFIREFSGKRGKKATIRRYKFSGQDSLAETTFPGSYIPIVPIYGQVTWINGKRILSSLIRQARDPQRRLNHWAGKESELLSMAPVAPVMAEEGTLVNDRGQWQSPGKEMVLEYTRKNLDGEKADVPTRLQPPPIPTGIINAMEGAKENIKESMGIYNAGLGKREGDASGIALQQLDKSGDVATFHFPDNVRRSYGHMGEIAIEMIPIVYDTPRTVQTLNDENDVVMVGINGDQLQEGQKQHYDLTKGKYRVRITTGASYTTKRQEEAAFLQAAFKADPQLMQIGGDILFNSLDTPGAQALGARFKKTINPALLDDKDKPQIPPQITQEIQKMQQIIQAGAEEIQQLQQQLQSKQEELQIKSREVGVKEADVQVKAIIAQNTPKPVQDNSDQIEIIKLQMEERTQEQEFGLKQQAAQLAEKEFELKQLQFQYEVAQQLIASQQPKLASDDNVMPINEGDNQAGIKMLSSIAEQLNNLSQAVMQPKAVVRDPNTGLIVGVQ